LGGIYQQAYPDFNLEDKVDFDGGGNVTSGNNANTRTIKEMGREKNNEEVSSDAMIVGNSLRMQKVNSLIKDYV